jgi:hypothetical protein
MTTKDIRTKLLQLGFDAVRFSKKGTWSIKWGYFYRHGVTPQSLFENIKKLFPEASLVNAEDRWNAWPKDSYMLVEFTIPNEIQLSK